MIDEPRDPERQPLPPAEAGHPAGPRRPYATPRLSAHGTIARQTLGSPVVDSGPDFSVDEDN